MYTPFERIRYAFSDDSFMSLPFKFLFDARELKVWDNLIELTLHQMELIKKQSAKE